MTSFDSSGRLRVVLNALTSSTGSPLAVRASGALGTVSDTNVSTLVFSGSFLSASSPSAGQVIINYAPNAPIMYISGFRGSATPSERNLYMATGSGFFVGASTFMCSALFCIAFRDEPSHIAGNSAGGFGASNNWSLTDQGFNYSNHNIGAEVDFVTALKTAATPYAGKWHIATMHKDGTDLGVFVDQQGARAVVPGASTPAWHTNISFSIGVCNNGAEVRARLPIRIAAVALRTGSAVADKSAVSRFHSQVVLDGDIRQHAEMGWDHIWSVKQNTPGASWIDAIGAFHLTRSGTLSILTESNPRWG